MLRQPWIQTMWMNRKSKGISIIAVIHPKYRLLNGGRDYQGFYQFSLFSSEYLSCCSGDLGSVVDIYFPVVFFKARTLQQESRGWNFYAPHAALDSPHSLRLTGRIDTKKKKKCSVGLFSSWNWLSVQADIISHFAILQYRKKKISNYHSPLNCNHLGFATTCGTKNIQASLGSDLHKLITMPQKTKSRLSSVTAGMLMPQIFFSPIS